MKLLDTTVAVDHLRGRSEATLLLERLADDQEDVLASELVRFELLAGVRPAEVPALEAFFSTIVWVPVVEEITRAAAEHARRHRRSHGAIDDVDYLIAATATVLEAELLTTNVKHFPMIEGLRPAY